MSSIQASRCAGVARNQIFSCSSFTAAQETGHDESDCLLILAIPQRLDFFQLLDVCQILLPARDLLQANKIVDTAHPDWSFPKIHHNRAQPEGFKWNLMVSKKINSKPWIVAMNERENFHILFLYPTLTLLKVGK
ncbi:MAG: hypothetical protein HY308_02470 [Gammaproteobacteria bacterium]|nr:hypothetical protein [Gammaproteobacteria bacterium]